MQVNLGMCRCRGTCALHVHVHAGMCIAYVHCCMRTACVQVHLAANPHTSRSTTTRSGHTLPPPVLQPPS